MLPDRWNPRMWAQAWLLRPGRTDEVQINTTAHGSPKAVEYGSLCCTSAVTGPFVIEEGTVAIRPDSTTPGESR